MLSEHFRYDDILRWKAGQNMKQAILGMYFPSPGEYDLNGDGQNDICLYTDTKPGNAQGITYLKIDSDIKLSDGNKGYLSPHKTSRFSGMNNVIIFTQYPLMNVSSQMVHLRKIRAGMTA